MFGPVRMFCGQFISIVLGLGIFASTVTHAASLSDAEFHFLYGHQAYLSGKFGICANEFYKAITLGVELMSRAELYLSYCQERLDLKDLAAFHIRQVNEDELSSHDRRIYQYLKSLLRKRIKDQEKVTYSFFPYFGLANFSSGSPKTSGNFFGVYAERLSENWRITLGGERLVFSLLNSAPDYSQYTGILGISRIWETNSEAHARFAYIFSSLQSQSGISVFQGGGSFWLWTKARLNLDGFFSFYPHSTFGSLNVFQASISLDQWLYSIHNFEFWIRLGSHSVFPTANLTTDSVTGLVLKNAYERVSIDADLRWGSVQLGGSVWFGNEVFGVRNDAAIIFSAVEEHRFGWGGRLSYTFSPQWTASVTYTKEQYSIGVPNISSDSVFGMLVWRP